MANEKTWSTVPPQAFTANGGAIGQVQVADTAGFRVKALVTISAPGLPSINLQVKRVVNNTDLFVGDPAKPINNHAVDLSAYTVAGSAQITQFEQDKTKLRPDDMDQATYETDPIVAWRTLNVDQYGNPYSAQNPMPFAFDGTIKVGDVEVVGPTGNVLKPNQDGSLNVNVVETPVAGNVVKSRFNTASAVPTGILTSILTYTVPFATTAVLQKITVSGENIAKFTILLNGVVMDVKRTYFGGELNAEFNYETGNSNGLNFKASDIILIQVIHQRPNAGDFDGRIQVLEIAN